MPRGERARMWLRGLVKFAALVLVSGVAGMVLGIAISELTGDDAPPTVATQASTETTQAPTEPGEATTSVPAATATTPAHLRPGSARADPRHGHVRGAASGADVLRPTPQARSPRRAGHRRQPRDGARRARTAVAAGGAPACADERRRRRAGRPARPDRRRRNREGHAAVLDGGSGDRVAHDAQARAGSRGGALVAGDRHGRHSREVRRGRASRAAGPEYPQMTSAVRWTARDIAGLRSPCELSTTPRSARDLREDQP